MRNIKLEYEFEPTQYFTANRPMQLILDQINLVEHEIISTINRYKSLYLDEAKLFKSRRNNSVYWNNDWINGDDLFYLYSFIRDSKFNNIVEIGCGHSTKVINTALDVSNSDTKLTCIDPEPRSDINFSRVNFIRSKAEELGGDEILKLIDSDSLLIIDSSHYILVGNDGVVLYLDVLPRLPVGCSVLIHDIMIPFDYIMDIHGPRGYSEQYVLAALLISNPKRYSIKLPNYYAGEILRLYDSMYTELPNSVYNGRGGYFLLQISE